jgi:hypothetical protein
LNILIDRFSRTTEGIVRGKRGSKKRRARRERSREEKEEGEVVRRRMKRKEGER